MSEDTMISNIPEDELVELNAAVARVLQKNTNMQTILQRVDDLDQKRINLRAQKIYAEKEIALLAKKKAGELESDTASKDKFECHMYQLHLAQLTHGALHKGIQTTAKNVQVQEALHGSLQEVDMDKNVDSYPVQSELIKTTSENLEMTISMMKNMVEKEKLHNDILELRLKHQELLGNIEDKWKHLHGQQSKIAEGPAESEAIQRVRTKLQARESKLQIMVFLIKAILTSSGVQWGFNNHYIQLLLLCDEAMDMQQQNEQVVRNIMVELEQSRGRNVSTLSWSPHKEKTKTLKLMKYSAKKK